MNASADDAPLGQRRDDGWDDTVFVWNATVAKIPTSADNPDPARDAPASSTTTPRRSAEREIEH